MSERTQLILKREIVRIMALLYSKNLVTPMGGNVSVRLGSSRYFWITPSGRFKGDLKVSDIVKVPMCGKAPRRRKPSVETPLHLKIYRSRDDVKAVVHAHSPLTLGVALAGAEIKPLTPEGFVGVGDVPVAAFEAPGTEGLADKVVELLKFHPVAVMQNHGVVAVGRTLLEAWNRVEVVEATARLMTIAHMWGAPSTLTPSQIEKLKRVSTA